MAGVGRLGRPEIGDLRGGPRLVLGVEREQREYLRSSVLEAIAAATTRGEPFAEIGRVVERLAHREERFRESEERSRAARAHAAARIITPEEGGLIESLTPAARRRPTDTGHSHL